MTNKIGGFSPDLGLEYISRYDDRSPGLPAQREAQLTGEPVRKRLEELFTDQSIDQTLRRFVSPQLPDPALLTPAYFESVVRDSAEELRALAAAGNNPAFEQASQLLNHEVQLRELLAHYRGLLVKA